MSHILSAMVLYDRDVRFSEKNRFWIGSWKSILQGSIQKILYKSFNSFFKIINQLIKLNENPKYE